MSKKKSENPKEKKWQEFAERIPEDAVESEYAIERLGELNVLPRDEMQPIDFDKECSDTE